MPEVSVPEAAAILRVSSVRIRQLIAAGDLQARRVAGRWLVDLSSFPSTRRRGRPMSPRIAWAMAELVEGRRPPWISAGEAYRLRAQRDRLAADPSPELLLRSWFASRAQRHTLSGPEPDRLLNDSRLVLSGISDTRSGMSAANEVEAYAHINDLDDIRSDHLLIPTAGPRANIFLHAGPMRPEHPVPLLLLAADLAEHDGSRELGRARELIAAAVHQESNP